jgi:hypothetical protein
MDIFVDDLCGLLKGGGFQVMQGFFFEMTEEVFHRRIIPTVGRTHLIEPEL